MHKKTKECLDVFTLCRVAKAVIFVDYNLLDFNFDAELAEKHGRKISERIVNSKIPEELITAEKAAYEKTPCSKSWIQIAKRYEHLNRMYGQFSSSCIDTCNVLPQRTLKDAEEANVAEKFHAYEETARIFKNRGEL